MKGIYGIFKDDKPVYVGQSVNIYSRWGAHLDNYPYEIYEYRVLELCDDNSIREREQHWIEKMNTLLEGDNKANAVRQVEQRHKPPLPYPSIRYPQRRISLLNTFNGRSCEVCGETTLRYLVWWPHWNRIKQYYMRYGKRCIERTWAQGLIDDSFSVCCNCVTDKAVGEEKAPWPSKYQFDAGGRISFV